MTRWQKIRFGCYGILVLMMGGFGFSMIHMPLKSYQGKLQPLDSSMKESRNRLFRHVKHMAHTIGHRNVANPKALQECGNYLVGEFAKLGLQPQKQEYTVPRNLGYRGTKDETLTVFNVEAEVRGTQNPEHNLVIGAHYDSVIGSPGANDNASGVAVLLELARIFATQPQPISLRFVAFVNEEPPFFQTKGMGSLSYAQQLKERNLKIMGMISLETMGFYTDKEGTQDYPFPLSLAYPTKGNFVAFVGNSASGDFVRQSLRVFRQNARFPSEGIAAQEVIREAGFSDHWSFWQQGWPALMITDTAFCRYEHYHTEQDTVEKINYFHLTRITHGLVPVIQDLAKTPTTSS